MAYARNLSLNKQSKGAHTGKFFSATLKKERNESHVVFFHQSNVNEKNATCALKKFKISKSDITSDD